MLDSQANSGKRWSPYGTAKLVKKNPSYQCLITKVSHISPRTWWLCFLVGVSLTCSVVVLCLGPLCLGMVVLLRLRFGVFFGTNFASAKFAALIWRES